MKTHNCDKSGSLLYNLYSLCSTTFACEPTVEMYNILLPRLAQEMKWDQFFYVWAEMTIDGQYLSLSAFNQVATHLLSIDEHAG